MKYLKIVISLIHGNINLIKNNESITVFNIPDSLLHLKINIYSSEDSDFDRPLIIAP